MSAKKQDSPHSKARNRHNKKGKARSKSVFFARSRKSKKAKASLFFSVICLVFILVVNIVRPIILNYQADLQQIIRYLMDSIL